MRNTRRKNLEEARKVFIVELASKDYYWRINRSNTFLDLIKTTGYSYISNPTLNIKIRLINICLKAIIVERSTPLDFTNKSIVDLIKSVENENLLEKYDEIVLDLKEHDSRKSLTDELNYIRVYQDIVDKHFPLESIEEILTIILSE